MGLFSKTTPRYPMFLKGKNESIAVFDCKGFAELKTSGHLFKTKNASGEVVYEIEQDMALSVECGYGILKLNITKENYFIERY